MLEGFSFLFDLGFELVYLAISLTILVASVLLWRRERSGAALTMILGMLIDIPAGLASTSMYYVFDFFEPDEWVMYAIQAVSMFGYSLFGIGLLFFAIRFGTTLRRLRDAEGVVAGLSGQPPR
jgi:hypothetical protein